MMAVMERSSVMVVQVRFDRRKGLFNGIVVGGVWWQVNEFTHYNY